MDNILSTKYDPMKRIWSGGKRSPMFDFDCSIGRIIHTALRNYPNNICQICLSDGKTATNREILNWSKRLALNFQTRGLRHDDVICIAAKNSTYVTPAAVACFFNATPFHAVNPSLDVDTLTQVLSITKAKLTFCDAADYEKLKTASAGWTTEFITVTGKVEDVARMEDLLHPTKAEISYQPQHLLLGGEQTMAILCTSGTTGKPKVVCIPNYMLSAGNPLFSSESIVYSESSLHWYTGVINLLYSVVDGCTRIIPDKPFSAEYFLEIVDKFKVSSATFAPRHASALISCPEATPERLASLSVLFVGGGWMPSETLMQLKKILTRGIILFAYGATEYGAVSCSIYSGKLGNTVGKLLPGLSARIVSDNGKNLGKNEVGELYVNHGRKWNGYYGNPIETQRMQDSQGWFRSGDVGYFDKHGNLYIVDRKKEINKCLGMQYWPNEIEVAIAELPDVQEVCVVGLYDEKYGDAPAAMVVKKRGSSLSVDDIKQHVAKRMSAEFKQLHRGVVFADELPQNDNGKVLRRVVREKLTQETLDS